MDALQNKIAAEKTVKYSGLIREIGKCNLEKIINDKASPHHSSFPRVHVKATKSKNERCISKPAYVTQARAFMHPYFTYG